MDWDIFVWKCPNYWDILHTLKTGDGGTVFSLLWFTHATEECEMNDP